MPIDPMAVPGPAPAEVPVFPGAAALFDATATPALYVRRSRIERANPAFVRAFGHRPEALAGRHPADFLEFPDGYEAFRGAANERLDRGEPFSASFPLRLADGTARWAEITIRPISVGERASGALWSFEPLDARRESEALLRRHERDFRTLAEHARDVIIRVDRGHVLLYVNPAVQHYCGIPGEAFIGRRQEDLPFPAEYNARVLALTDEVFATGEALRREVRFEHQGRAWWFDGTATPEPGADGQVATVLWIARDITEQRAALARLTESEERYRTLVETSADGIAVARPDGTLVMVNGRAAQLFGPGEPASFQGESFLDYLAEGDRTEAARRLADVIAGGGRETHELRAVSRGGRRFPVEVNASVVPGADGAPQFVIGILRDVSQRKAEQEQLRLLAKVFTASRQGILITDATPAIVAVNQAFTEMTGYAWEDVAGRNPSFLSSGRHDRRFYADLWASLAQDGHWAGEVWNRRKDGEVFPESLHISAVKDDDGRVTNYVALLMDVTERKQTEARIRHLAQHDLLTDLPNRALLRDRAAVALARAQRARGGAALLFLDLDHFKVVNDSLGPPVGDGVLQELARRLALAVRGSDTVSRLGSDEFVVLMADLASVEDAARVAGKLIEAASRAFHVEGHEVLLTASVGIGIFPENGQDLDALVRNAEAAMHAAKSAGRSRFAFYSQEMNARALERYALENDLRRAIERGQLWLAYQPQVSLATGEISGAEALLRWNHPVHGAVSPARFIPIAEDSGLILPVGVWVLREACRQARKWRDAGTLAGRIAVNVSALQVRQGDFPDLVREVLAETGLPGSALEIEVTESVLMDSADVRPRLEALASLGVRIAIDDFGTGFSSLSYLRHFQVDRLKIDQSFVRDLSRGPKAARLLEGIVQLGHSLGFGVIAEGVETAEEAAALAAMGCDEAQGYLYGRPGPPETCCRGSEASAARPPRA